MEEEAMADFQFLNNPTSKQWTILAPRRSKRPDVARGSEPVCPFCPGREADEREVYRVSKPVIASETKQSLPGRQADQSSRIASSPSAPRNDKEVNQDANWLVRVIPNKFPFAPIHEIIIHSPDHNKGVHDLPLEHILLLLQTYRQRYNTHKEKGQVYIFHNRGTAAGESLPHGHTQLAVIPGNVTMDIPRFVPSSLGLGIDEFYTTGHFVLFCPKTSQWPDEVWIAPKRQGTVFGEITDDELSDFSFVLQRLIQIMHIRHNNEFPHNFYIYPGGSWYLRLIPRLKTLGGFEIGTGIFVNTQNPLETIAFIREHFADPNTEKILKDHQAEYHRGV